MLVTGGTGLVASALAAQAPDAVFVTRAHADLTDLAATRALFARLRPARVIHVAALTGGVRFNRDHNADLLRVNVQIDANVLAIAHEYGVERLVAMLASCAFDMPAARPATESDLHVGQPYAGNLGYATAKRLLDVQCRLYAQQYGAKFSTIAPVTIYGPHDHVESEDGHVMAGLFRRAAAARAADTPLTVWGTGRAVRQFVYVDDVARLLIAELGRDDGPDTTIVAPDDGVTIADLAARVAREMGVTRGLAFTGELEGQLVKVMRSERFATRHPDFRFTPLDEGLARTAAWLRGHHHSAAAREAHVV